MKNNLTNAAKVILAVMLVGALVLSFGACAKKTDSEKFEEARSRVSEKSNEALDMTKSICEGTLKNEQELFITAASIDSQYCINVHVLTNDCIYVTYALSADEMQRELCEALQSFEYSSSTDIEEYLRGVTPRVDYDKKIIYFE